MSEKVKLIIEIPKYYLEHPQDYTCLAECVRRGIPLEQIRAEIEDCKQYQFETYGIQRYFKIDDIWQIIDKYK